MMDSEEGCKPLAHMELFSQLGLREFVNTAQSKQQQQQQYHPQDEAGSSKISIILITVVLSLYMYGKDT
jgi:hypothetical protein